MINEEKKYQEALERAKKELNACSSEDCDVARQIFRLFPELNESKDERIRKAIIEHIDCKNKELHIDSNDSITVADAIAWLEKYEEQKPTWSEEDEETLNNILNDLSQHVIPDDEDMQWLKSLKDRMKGE